jgi:hypothetical protein
MTDKSAELLSGTSWVQKTGITGESIKSDDPQGMFRQDNYPWLFAWTDNSRALPSTCLESDVERDCCKKCSSLSYFVSPQENFVAFSVSQHV